jgi:hypothetical protein
LGVRNRSLYERRKVVVVDEGAEVVEELVHVLGGGGTKAAPQGL